MKLDTQTNSNMQNSMVVFTISLQTGNSLLWEFSPKNEDFHFKLNSAYSIYSAYQISASTDNSHFMDQLCPNHH